MFPTILMLAQKHMQKMSKPQKIYYDKQIAQLTEQAFLSTLSLRRATTQLQAAFKGPEISIHALLAESDGHTHYMGVYEQISIHALLAESEMCIRDSHIAVHSVSAALVALRKESVDRNSHNP